MLVFFLLWKHQTFSMFNHQCLQTIKPSYFRQYRNKRVFVHYCIAHSSLTSISCVWSSHINASYTELRHAPALDSDHKSYKTEQLYHEKGQVKARNIEFYRAVFWVNNRFLSTCVVDIILFPADFFSILFEWLQHSNLLNLLVSYWLQVRQVFELVAFSNLHASGVNWIRTFPPNIYSSCRNYIFFCVLKRTQGF